MLAAAARLVQLLLPSMLPLLPWCQDCFEAALSPVQTARLFILGL